MRPALAAVLLALLAGCGSDGAALAGPDAPGSPGRAVAATTPAICGPLRVTTLGRVRTPAAAELSGLVQSPDQPGVLWTHNDSGDRPRVLALSTGGALRGDLAVPGAQAIDWEDLALGPGAPGAGRALYLADIGDNAADRDMVELYRVPEPRLPAGTATAPADRLVLRYPDGPHDAETLLVEPGTGEIAIVTKAITGASAVYVTAPWRTAGNATRTLRRTGTLALGLGGLATGGDVSADRRTVVVRTYTGFVAWRKRPGDTLAATLRRTPCRGRTTFPGERQGEALGLAADGRSFVTVPEGARPLLRRYAAAGR